MIAEPVAEPLHGGTGDEDRGLQRIVRAARRFPRRRCREDQGPGAAAGSPCSAARTSRSRMCSCRPRIDACLSEQRRLLVTRPRRRPAPRGRAARRDGSSPGCRELGRTSGGHGRERRSSSSSSGSHAPAPMSNSMVREAFDGSVGCASPVSLKMQPGVDRAEHRAPLLGPLPRPSRCPVTTRSSSPRSTDRARARARPDHRREALRAQLSHRAAVRRSCHTIAW